MKKILTGIIAAFALLVFAVPASAQMTTMGPIADETVRPKQPPSFPASLDPYEYRPPHEQWWDSFLHIGYPFALTSDLLLVTVWMSRGMAEAQNFANVYTSDGTVVAEGLRVPNDGRIVGAGNGRVFVVRNAAISNTGSTERLEFYAYVFRQEADGWRDRDYSVSR